MEASDTVGHLITLQEINLEILKINEELERLTKEEADLNLVVEKLEARESRFRDQAEGAEERVQQFQRAVHAGRETLKRLETRVAAVLNMQQHFAVKSETDTARRNLRMAEDDQLEAMQDVETARAGLANVDSDLGQARETLLSRGAEGGQARSSLEGELVTHASSKQAQESRININTLRLYQSVSRRRKDSALAGLTSDGVCGRCYTAVPKQRRADIRSGLSLAVCEGCGVILHAETTDA